MGDRTGIEWTEATWNPVVGCAHVSPGCDHCYAAREASGRLRHIPVYSGLAEAGRFTGEVRWLPERLDQPLRWKRPRRIFVNSMSDLFHPSIPDEFIAEVFGVMPLASHHTFQLLTKRPQRMATLMRDGDRWLELLDEVTLRRKRRIVASLSGYPLPNVWLGTSIESDRYAFRADHVRATPAAVRWLSLEPLLGPLRSLDLIGIDWVVVGGETGPQARPMHPAWVRDIRDRCVDSGVPFFFKQWGDWGPGNSTERWRVQLSPDGGPGIHFPPGEYARPSAETAIMQRVGKKAAGAELDGRTWEQYPAGAGQ